MPLSSPRVSIIIINWNNYNDTKVCLESLKQISYSDYEIILVDNGSKDDSLEKIKAEFPDCIYVCSNKNLGFGGGNNLGIKRALGNKSDYILLLNNDTRVEKKFLDHLVKTAEEDKKTGIVGCKIYLFDNPDIIWFAGGYLYPIRARAHHFYKEPVNTNQREITVNFITGCVMLIRREVIENIGVFDERYFLTVEDWDYSYRAVRNNWVLKVNLDSHIWHKVGVSNKGKALYYTNRGKYLFIKKLPFKYRFVAFPYFILTRFIKCIYLIFTNQKSQAGSIYKGLRDGITMALEADKT